VLNLRSVDRKTLAVSTALFKVINRGMSLKGYRVYRSLISEEVQSVEAHWTRGL
jgi:hypothetical protein